MHHIGRRSFATVLLAGTSLLAARPALAQGQNDEQALVDQATLTVNEMLGDPNFKDTLEPLRRARAIMVIPRKFRASFFIGGGPGVTFFFGKQAISPFISFFYGAGGASLVPGINFSSTL